MDSTKQLILDIHRHSMWANGQLLNAAENLPPEQLRTPIGEGGHGDLLATLVHMYDAQQSWLDRARTGTSGPEPDISDYMDISALRAAWERLDADMDAYVAGLDEDALLELASYRSFYWSEGSYSRKDMMLHRAFHSHQPALRPR